jgi:predicted aspartyl protease
MVTKINFRIATPTKPALLVPTLVNGKGPYEFALDTGAATTVLSQDLANSLGLKAGIASEGIGAGGRVGVSITSVDSLAIGEAKQDNLQVAITDLSLLSKAVGTTLAGIIGYNFLKNFKMTIDYSHGILTLESSI